jgi:hypothetical protein
MSTMTDPHTGKQVPDLNDHEYVSALAMYVLAFIIGFYCFFSLFTHRPAALFSLPAPFNCSFTPRSRRTSELINNSFTEFEGSE